MTQKEAYIEGFCKAAEAYGVDPRQLIKVAVPLKQLLAVAGETGYISPQLAKALTNVGKYSPTYARKMWHLPSTAHALETTRRAKSVARANKALSRFFSEGKHSIGISDPVTKQSDFWAQLLSGKGFKFDGQGAITIKGKTSLDPFIMRKLLG